jgi:outer membrane lipoprotein-sorting protein
MRNKIVFHLFAVLIIGFGFMGFDTTEPSATEIIKKMDSKFRGLSSQSTMTMSVVRPKWTRTMKMKSWTKGDDYSLILVTEPVSDKGVAFLKREKEMWQWQPSIGRVIKLLPSMMSQSWMGSDFTNDDLSNQSSIIVDYDHQKTGKVNLYDRECYKIELTPKPDAPVVWGRIVVWVDTKEYLQLKTEFYDEDNYLVNTMRGSEIKNMNGRTVTTRMDIIPEDESGNKTILIYNDIKFDVKLEDSFFSVQNMKNVR